MYMQEQMIKNKRDIPKEEVQSERIVFFFKLEINNLLLSLFLQMAWD